MFNGWILTWEQVESLRVFWVEVADAFIRILDLAGAHKIDLEHIIELKHEYNKTRPHRHGGKVI